MKVNLNSFRDRGATAYGTIPTMATTVPTKQLNKGVECLKRRATFWKKFKESHPKIK